MGTLPAAMEWVRPPFEFNPGSHKINKLRVSPGSLAFRFAAGASRHFLLCLLSTAAAAQQTPLLTDAGAELGKVHFETSCSPKAQGPFEHAVALLHSFEFGPAIAEFRAALAVDPTCAIANWGIALGTWGNPFAPGLEPRANLERGREASLPAGTKHYRRRRRAPSRARRASVNKTTTKAPGTSQISEANCDRNEVLTTIRQSDPRVRPVTQVSLEKLVPAKIESDSYHAGEVPLCGSEQVVFRPVVSPESHVQFHGRSMQDLPAMHGGEAPIRPGGDREGGKFRVFVEELAPGNAKCPDLPAAVVQFDRHRQDETICPVPKIVCFSDPNQQVAVRTETLIRRCRIVGQHAAAVCDEHNEHQDDQGIRSFDQGRDRSLRLSVCEALTPIGGPTTPALPSQVFKDAKLRRVSGRLPKLPIPPSVA
jgi:hypothetical protein